MSYAKQRKLRGQSLAKIEQQIEKARIITGENLTNFLINSKVGRTTYDQLLKTHNCTIKTLERFADYTNLPISFFLDDFRDDLSQHYHNSTVNEIQAGYKPTEGITDEAQKEIGRLNRMVNTLQDALDIINAKNANK